MKAISFLLLALVIACNPNLDVGRRRQLSEVSQPMSPAPQPQTQPKSTPAPIPVPQPKLENTKGHELVIEIDQVNNILTVTGNAGRVCNIDFLVPHKMHYEVHSASQATITLDGRVFELDRIDDSDSTKIFGDWTAAVPEGGLSGNIIFHIRLDPVMKVEADCQ